MYSMMHHTMYWSGCGQYRSWFLLRTWWLKKTEGKGCQDVEWVGSYLCPASNQRRPAMASGGMVPPASSGWIIKVDCGFQRSFHRRLYLELFPPTRGLRDALWWLMLMLVGRAKILRLTMGLVGPKESCHLGENSTISTMAFIRRQESTCSLSV